jgi:DNA mismatch repair protein MutL
VRDRLYPLDVQQGPARLSGFVADPACERGNAKMQYLFVNGRWVRDRSLAHALQEAYRGLLMTGRYPVAFLFLELPHDQVDVNVHPTKAEVRFRDGQALYHLVHSAVRNCLSGANLTARLQVPSSLAAPQSVGGQETSWFAPRSLPAAAPPLFSTAALEPSPATGAATPMLAPAPHNGSAPDALPAPAPPAVPVPMLQAPPLKVIQLYSAYLVLETPEGMLVIDQHALHERILFEQLKARLRTGTLETQQLLIPETVEFGAEQAARTLEQRAALAELGLGIEDFGGGTLLLTSYPAIIGNRSPASVLRAVADHLASKDRMPTREQFLNDVMSLMACHAAVKAGDPLTAEEIAALVAQRELAQDTHHCPHGRPTALLFSRADLDRQFRRT